jgi:primosomal protein N' (replication factor Y)
VTIARVLTDVAGIPKEFDYLVPEALETRVTVGTMVRVPLGGRRVGGWGVGLSSEASTDRPLRPLAKVTGFGPPADLVELADWAAWRWAGRRSAFLKTASPPRAVVGLPPPSRGERPPASPPGSLAADAFKGGLVVARVPPADDVMPFVLEAARHDDALVLAPSLATAGFLAARLRRLGVAVAELPRDWARAAAGGCVAVGARAGAWAPRPRIGAVLVLDEGDEAYQEERAPTWNARDVAVERARRAGVPCVLVSPAPSLESLAIPGVVLLTPARSDERAGWPVVDVVDRRSDPPGAGLYSSRVVDLLRQAGSGRRVVCVLNRKGRARLLACAACGELARCEVCEGPVAETGSAAPGSADVGVSITQIAPIGAHSADFGAISTHQTPTERLECRRCGAVRPVVCTNCGATRLKTLRVGVTRAREELELLAGLPVGEVTADSEGPLPDAPVLVGTEAVLHRVAGAHGVAFLDFDQELLAPRYRAGEQALGMVARAARLVGGRDGAGRIVVQTRLPDHEVLDAAIHADPSRFTVVESARRAALQLPPETAMAVVSGEAAPAFIEALTGVEIMGPSAGRWLLRAPDHATLADALAATPRPSGRLRVEVDPRRT